MEGDLQREARSAMMYENTIALRSMYNVDGNLMTVFYYEYGMAIIYSFTEKPKEISL